jgi:hypothetical protein
MYTTRDPIANGTELRTPPAIMLVTASERDKPFKVSNVDIPSRRTLSGKPLLQLNADQIYSIFGKLPEMMYSESKFANQRLIFKWPGMDLCIT